jgi:hypothetical protein
VLEIPPGTVRSRIARGRAALADTLGPARDSTASDSAASDSTASDDTASDDTAPEDTGRSAPPGNRHGVRNRPNPAHE